MQVGVDVKCMYTNFGVCELSYSLDCHKSLLEEQIDFLPAVLLPLAGPELFNDEENDQLPLECQYLPDDKIREDIPDVRTMLLEILLKVSLILLQLCVYVSPLAVCEFLWTTLLKKSWSLLHPTRISQVGTSCYCCRSM